MLAAPEPTAYDLRFRALGIPVRVSPWFWAVTALLGWGNPTSTVIWVACVFVSILVHEYGHGLMTRAIGGHPRIVLYGMGGLCSSDELQTPRQRLAVLAWGPGAGFALLGVVLLVLMIAYQVAPREILGLIQLTVGVRPDPEVVTGLLTQFRGLPILWNVVQNLIWINLFWGLLNLLPIWPLDGGQIAGVLLTQANRRQGPYWTHVISLVTAGIVGVAAFQYTQSLFLVLFFGLFALNNFQILQALQHVRSGGFGDDADDWWRK
jgi:Zn-dependent protease